MGRSRRIATLFAALALTVGACSSGGTPEAIDSTASGAPNPTGSKSVAPSKTKGGAKGGGTVPGSNVGDDDGPVPGSPPVKPVTGLEPADLFTAAEDRIGITDDKIVLCVHAALSLSTVFNISQESLNVYWEYVNQELGGVYGRRIEISYTDDNYGNQPQDVRNAYDGCKARNPFIMMGGIGFDQIPQVRAWAEEDHQLYIHHIAREDPSKKYAFSYLPSVEDVGRLAGEWIVKAHRNDSIGVIWRNSEHWEPGHKAFKAALAKQNMRAEKDLPVQKSASVYSTQIRELANANIETVFIWENALAAIEIIRQAQDQGYTPQWVVFPFNLMSDTLGEDTIDPVPVEGIATWAPYMPGVQNPVSKAYTRGKIDGPFKIYADLIKEFERQHNRYAPGENRDDIVFMTWAAWAQLHKLLLQCGKDCTRNKIVALLQSGQHKMDAPGCPIDFSRSNVGSHSVMVFRAFHDPEIDRYGWREIEHCRTSFV